MKIYKNGHELEYVLRYFCDEEFLQKDAKDGFAFGKGGKTASVFRGVAHNEECGVVKRKGRKVWSKPSLSAVTTASVWELGLCSVHWSCCSDTNT